MNAAHRPGCGLQHVDRRGPCLTASRASWSCAKKHRASILETVGPETVDPEVVGDVRGSWFDDRITRKDRMISRIALDRAMQQTIVT